MPFTKKLLFLFLISAWSTLDAGTNGSLEGYVTDKNSKEALIGATILLKELNIGGVTNVDGFYTINNIPAGSYDVTVSYIGYQSLTVKGVSIKSG